MAVVHLVTSFSFNSHFAHRIVPLSVTSFWSFWSAAFKPATRTQTTATASKAHAAFIAFPPGEGSGGLTGHAAAPPTNLGSVSVAVRLRTARRNPWSV